MLYGENGTIVQNVVESYWIFMLIAIKERLPTES